MTFCLALPERAGVVAIPTQPFYDDPDAGRQLIRWAFCKQTSGDRGGPQPAGGGPEPLNTDSSEAALETRRSRRIGGGQ